MDSEQRGESEKPDLFMVACIDFSGSSATLPVMGICPAEIIDEIKRKKRQDKHCLYLLHRIRLPTLCDPIVREHFERRMLKAVALLKRELLPGNAAVEEQELPPSEADSSVQSVPDVYATWCERTLVSEGPEANSLENQVCSGCYFWYGPQMYPMSLPTRGMCIIINNSNFKGATGRRDGSEHDVRRMVALFTAFLFNCEVHIDKTADEMKELLSEAAQSRAQEGAQCLVVILMSHGNQDTIQGVDGAEVNLMNDVYAPFNNVKCPALKGKPKLFFIQACRGNEGDSGDGTTEDVAADSAPQAAEKPQCAERRATWSDMYIAYAVISGHNALRDENAGSWFLSAVYTVFSEHAATEDLETMMRKVHAEVLQKSSNSGRGQTPNVQVYGWWKWLYFNPKLYLRFS